MTEEIKTKERETKVPIFRIRQLLRMKKELDNEVKFIMEKYNVEIGYIRGLMKLPMNEKPPAKKKTKKEPEPAATKPARKPRTTKKKPVDNSDLIG